jgi:hypothetical protein
LLHDESPILVDGEAARLQVLEHNNKELVEELIERVCRGPSETRQGDAMPGDSTIRNGEHLQAESIVTWAAAGALRNLALSAKARQYLLHHVEQYDDVVPLTLCLCELTTSEDWLEKLKAEDALFHLGVHDACHAEAPPLDTYAGPCVDQLGWLGLSEDKEFTCWDYEPRQFDSGDHYEDGHDEKAVEQLQAKHYPDYYCDKYGDVEGAILGDDSSKISAQEACCFCGGGYRFSNKNHDHDHDGSGDEEEDEDGSSNDEEGEDEL